MTRKPQPSSSTPRGPTMVGLDTTMGTMLDEDAIARIAAGGGDRARFGDMLDHYLGFYEMLAGRRACPLHDPERHRGARRSSLITRALHADYVTVATSDEAPIAARTAARGSPRRRARGRSSWSSTRRGSSRTSVSTLLAE